MYFSNCKTIDQAKNLFRELCLKLHPDTSGADTQNEFIKMYAEFKKFSRAKQEKANKRTTQTNSTTQLNILTS
jgi:hypothetical protein